MSAPSRWPVGLAVLGTDARTGGTPDTCAWIGDCHDLAFKLLIVVQGDQNAIFGQALQGHHRSYADLEAPAAADTDLLRDVEKIRWTPCASIARQRKRCHLCSHLCSSRLENGTLALQLTVGFMRALRDQRDLLPVDRKVLGEIVQVHLGLYGLRG